MTSVTILHRPIPTRFLVIMVYLNFSIFKKYPERHYLHINTNCGVRKRLKLQKLTIVVNKKKVSQLIRSETIKIKLELGYSGTDSSEKKEKRA